MHQTQSWRSIAAGALGVVTVMMAIGLAACAKPKPAATAPARQSADASREPLLAACERDQWVSCWRRALDGSIAGASMAAYRQGCHDRRPADCMRLAIFTGDVELRPDLFQRACDGGIPDGCGAIGGAWAAVARTRHDSKERAILFAKAYALLDDGCKRGDAGACSTLATSYASGDGVAVDAERARGYASRSCELAKMRECQLLVDVECTVGGPCPSRDADR